MEISTIITRLIIASILGGIIGIERDRHGRSAGLRTQLLVCMGSALFMIISLLITSYPDGERIGDPGRIASQIIAGIGFLGAGAIIKSGYTIRGLTTAASMWVAAGIGMGVGAGYYAESLIATGLVMASLLLLRPIITYMKHDSYRVLTVVMAMSADPDTILNTVKEDKNISISYFDMERDYREKTTKMRLSLQLLHKGDTDQYAHALIGRIERLRLPLKMIHWDHHE